MYSGARRPTNACIRRAIGYVQMQCKFSIHENLGPSRPIEYSFQPKLTFVRGSSLRSARRAE